MELITLFFFSNCKPINSRRVIQSSYRPRQSNKITLPICKIFYVPFQMRINSGTFRLLLDSLVFYDLKWFMYLLKNCTAANLNNMIRITLVLLCCDIKSQFCDSFHLPTKRSRAIKFIFHVEKMNNNTFCGFSVLKFVKSRLLFFFLDSQRVIVDATNNWYRDQRKRKLVLVRPWYYNTIWKVCKIVSWWKYFFFFWGEKSSRTHLIMIDQLIGCQNIFNENYFTNMTIEHLTM